MKPAIIRIQLHFLITLRFAGILSTFLVKFSHYPKIYKNSTNLNLTKMRKKISIAYGNIKGK